MVKNGDEVVEEEEIQVTAKDIILQPFMLDDDRVFRETVMSQANNPLQKLGEDEIIQRNHGMHPSLYLFLAMNAYLSTPKFIKHLTDISFELIAVQNRDEYLRIELKKINLKLPAAVYIPFVNSKIRKLMTPYRFY